MKNYYEILEIKVTASQDEISASYKRLMKVWHPDVNKQADAIEKTKELNQAYATLSKPHARRAYDLQFDIWGASDPLERVPNANPHGRRTAYDGRTFVQNIVIVGDQIWVNGVRVR